MNEFIGVEPVFVGGIQCHEHLRRLCVQPANEIHALLFDNVPDTAVVSVFLHGFAVGTNLHQGLLYLCEQCVSVKIHFDGMQHTDQPWSEPRIDEVSNIRVGQNAEVSLFCHKAPEL